MTSFPSLKINRCPNLLLYYLTQAMYALCSSDIYRYPGETSPERVEMAIGESVNISCHMHPSWFPGKNSSDLYFVGGPSQEPISEDDVAIVNASTIVLMLRNATERQTSYMCKIGREAIMASKVNVGTAPKAVHDFDCRAYDLDYMLCNFTQPENPVLTQYNLTFHTLSLDYIYQPICNYELKRLVVCNITLSQKHNPTVEYLYFTLKAINALGTLTQHFDVNIWNVMIPARPGKGFRVTDISTDKLQATWKTTSYNDKFKGLQWEIMLQPDGASELSWLNASSLFLMRTKMDVRLRLADLPYAFYRYLLKIRVRVRTAIDPETMWSAPFLYHFQTSAKRPDGPPRTDVGSFYVDPTETQVRLYWEELPEHKKNGYNLTYEITEIKKNGKVVQLQPIRLELNSAVYIWQKNVHYEFLVKSCNHVGESPNASLLEIAPFTQRNYAMHTPRPIHNVYDATNRTYTLTWDPPESKEDLLDYTVYWCRSKRALQNECKGSIHFTRIEKHDTRFTTDTQSPQEEHTLNMAVSANYLNYNTGMHWTPCTVDISSDLVKMAPEIQAHSATSIRIQLSPENVCPSILQGYNLTYCELESANGVNSEPAMVPCIKPLRTIILNKNLKQFDLNELKPYTNYRFEIFMYSRQKVGKASDPLVVRTQEAAPSPPRQLTVYNITNTSATISWLPPSQPNGIVRYYIVLLNNAKYRISASSDDSDPGVPKFVFQLRNLHSFTAYKVYVAARTVENSNPSNDVHFSTLIGYPSVPRNVAVKGKNVIQWSRPLEPSGRVDFYEVAVLIKRNDELIRKRITIVSAPTCELQVPACVDHEHKTTLEVRAVNAALRSHERTPDDSFFADSWDDDDAALYEGNNDLSCLGGKEKNDFQYYRDKAAYIFFKSVWQSGPTYGCATTRLSKIATIAVMVVVFSAMATVVIRKKYNKMANINCALPPGLENYPTKPNDPDAADKAGDYSSKKLIFHNEKYHLLAPLGNDSTYLDHNALTNFSLPLRGNVNSVANSLSNSPQKSTTSLAQAAISDDQLDKTGVADGLNTVNMATSATAANTSATIVMPPNSSGYIKSPKMGNFPNGVLPLKKSEELPSIPQCGGGGYVSVGSIANSSLPNNNYILPQTVQKVSSAARPLDVSENDCAASNGCYIKFNAFNKESIAQPLHSECDRTAEEPGKLICGYVTQRDLTVFGQQRLY